MFVFNLPPHKSTNNVLRVSRVSLVDYDKIAKETELFLYLVSPILQYTAFLILTVLEFTKIFLLQFAKIIVYVIEFLKRSDLQIIPHYSRIDFLKNTFI